MNLVCSQCSVVNRVSEAKLHDKPICGKCKTNLLPTHPVELTDRNFGKFVAKTEIPIVVDFWAPWCGPCRMMAPAFEEAALQLSPNRILAKLNTDDAPATAAQQSISGIPTLIYFCDGKEVARKSGVIGAIQIVQWARSY